VLIWFDWLTTPDLTLGVAGIAELGGTVSDADAGAETVGGVMTGAGAAGVGCGSTCGAGATAGAAFVSDVVGTAAGWVSVGTGVTGVFSTGGGVAGAGGVAAAGGEFCDSGATGGASVGTTAFVAGAAPGSGGVVGVAGVVAAGASGGVAACASWFEGESISPSFWSNAVRAAA
jgi:hypothetical protein